MPTSSTIKAELVDLIDQLLEASRESGRIAAAAAIEAGTYRDISADLDRHAELRGRTRFFIDLHFRSVIAGTARP